MSGLALGLGWLQGTSRTADRDALVAFLGNVFGPWKDRPSGLQWYASAVVYGDSRVLVAWDPRSSSSPASEVFVQVPQSALDTLGWEGSYDLLDYLVTSFGLRPSRVDIYVDDPLRTTDPAEVLQALRDHNVRTHARAWRHVEDSGGGMTAYVGSRTGECMVRVYRKWAESADPGAGTRWEMECKGERADLVASLLLSSSGDVTLASRSYLGLLRHFVEFVDRADGQRGDRAPLLGWWAAFVGQFDRVGLTLRKVVDSLDRKRRWIARQVAPTLALLFAVDGSDGLSGHIRQGWDRAPWHLVGSGAA